MSFFPTDGGGIFKQGAFQIDPNTTPEMLARKREMLAAMMPQYGRAKYIGEGIGQLGTAIASNRQNSAMDKFEGERRQEAAGQFNNVMSGQGPQSPRSNGPLSILGMRPEPQSPDQRIADDTMTALGQPKQGGDRDAFIQQMMPHAQRVAQQTGLDPRIIIAQAAQETGWGKSAPGNNYFGIKSHGQAGGNTFATNEVVDGQTVRVNDSFRGYEGMGDSVDGYAQFLQDNPRYKDMLSAGDLDSQVAALGQSGYATDPNYANSVGSIARSIQIPQGGAQVAQNGGRLNDLMMAAQNPWLSTQQRQVINNQIQQDQSQQQAIQQRQYAREDFLWEKNNTRKDIKTQFVKGLGLINSATGEVINDFGGAAGALAGVDPAQVQSSTILGDGSTVMVMKNGTRLVRKSTGEVVEGDDAAAAIKAAREYEVANQRSIYSARVEGGNTAEAATGGDAAYAGTAGDLQAKIDLGGQAEGAKDLGTASMAAGVGAWESYGKMQTSLGNIDTAIAAIDSGAKSGVAYNMLPSITEASASLENSMNRMGLDIVGAVTFGALSEGELRLAMSTAVPQNLGPAELRSWLVKRRDAQSKSAAMIADAAQYLTNPRNNLNGWIEKNRQARQAEQPAQGGASGGSATHVFNPETGKLEPVR